jgi:hypothetical protein
MHALLGRSLRERFGLTRVRATAATRAAVSAWGLSELEFTTELIVGELVTNAIRYGDAPFELRLIETDTIICEVSDAGSTGPTPAAGPRLRRGRTRTTARRRPGRRALGAAARPPPARRSGPSNLCRIHRPGERDSGQGAGDRTAFPPRSFESHIGRDLRFIRINGTVVGSLAGLLIYTVSRVPGAGCRVPGAKGRRSRSGGQDGSAPVFADQTLEEPLGV